MEDKTSPIVSIQLWVSAGSVDEKDEEAGFAHFLEHLTFRSKDIAKRVEDLGGDINAYTTLDRTVYYLSIPSNYYEIGIKVLSDIFYATEFSEESFITEKDVILEEMKRSYDDPQREIFKFFFESTLKDHPARRPVIGYEETIKTSKKQAITQFYNSFYRNDRAYLVVVGNINKDEVLKAIGRYFNINKSSLINSEIITEKKIDHNYGVFIKKKNVNSCYLMLGFPTPNIYSDDIPKIDVLSYLYGESSTSLLNEVLKEKKQLVNYVYSYQLSTKDLGFFIIQSNFSCKNTDNVIEEITNLLFKEDLPISDNNLKKVLKNYETSYLFSREKYEDIARDIGHSYFYFKDPEYSKKYIELIKKVSKEDIKKAKKKYLHPERLSLSLLVPNQVDEKDLKERARLIIEKNKAYISREVKNTIQLKNGIRLSYYKKDNSNTFSINLSSLAGSRMEEIDEAGLSYFVASAALRGTNNKTYKDILEEIESIGGKLGAYSTKNLTGINGQFLKEDFEKAVALIADIITNFNPPKAEIEKVRKLILEEIKRKKERPTNVLRELYFSEVFKDTIFSYPTEGVEDTINRFSENDVKRMFFNIFSPDKIHIALSGDLPDNYLDIMNKYFEPLTQVGPKKPINIYPSKKINNVTLSSNFNQSHIMVGFIIPGIRSDLRHKFHLLSQILSNQSGRLFTNLRDQKGLAYTVGSFIFEFPEVSLFNLYIGTSPEKVETSKKGLMEEINDIFINGISEEELNKAKNQIIFNYSQLMQKSSDIASTLTQNHIFFDNPFHFNNFLEEIRNVDIASFTKDIRGYFLEEKAFFIILDGKQI